MHDEHEQPGGVDEGLMPEKNLAKHGQITNEWYLPDRQDGWGTTWVLEEHRAAQKARDPNGKNIEDGTANDVIHPAVYSQHSMPSGHDAPHQERRQHSYPDVGTVQR